MKTVEQTKEMLINLESKLKQESQNLERGFQEKDFEKVNRAAKELDLYARRGFELGMDDDSKRMNQRVREEFFELMMNEFDDAGIEVSMPKHERNGEAIYFKIQGENVGVLYGEFDEVRGELLSNQNPATAVMNKLEDYKEKLKHERREQDKYKKKVLELQALKENLSLIHTDEYKDYRVGSKSNLFFVWSPYAKYTVVHKGKFIGKLVNRYNRKQLEKILLRDKTKGRFDDYIERSQELVDVQEPLIACYEKSYRTLSESQEEFTKRLTALLQILKTYNIPVKE
ncbi:hypothetical protein JMA_40480 (plasmid) [Jeotgalibacillus malaysiensis]|uniref:Uncharacterized protein n=1 Tax=Jeotgalibacillus malaysiensis TaxID=1508404 RepID=A0A0B5ATF3_9BACL|nr:hypothetical protein [Jeotgalibacillus malaysiensis]AJD93366.1 hypothetical protein JMA_40480 [Jeotgalibacillus malaysiensis]